MTNEITWDKIKEIQLKLNKEQSLAFRQKIKELYCSGFKCDIENFCVILPSEYEKEFTKEQLYLYRDWLFFTEFTDEAYAFKNTTQHWSADAENIFS